MGHVSSVRKRIQEFLSRTDFIQGAHSFTSGRKESRRQVGIEEATDVSDRGAGAFSVLLPFGWPKLVMQAVYSKPAAP